MVGVLYFLYIRSSLLSSNLNTRNGRERKKKNEYICVHQFREAEGIYAEQNRITLTAKQSSKIRENSHVLQRKPMWILKGLTCLTFILFIYSFSRKKKYPKLGID